MDSEFSSCDTLESTSQDGSSEPRNLPLEYLRNITNNFSDDRLLGEGGFGTVYKGVLPNGEMIAVKKLNSSMLPGVKDKQFENEAYHLMRLKHPNILLLLGWCTETENIYVEYNGKHICAEKYERLLCLEYMPNGNLRQYLKDESSGLTWEIRYKIIKGICYGLHYLHEERQLNAPIVHMDLKPANILLDNNMVPKIADFGLSRLFSEEKTWTCTTNRDGTLGYMAPEYINRGLISIKSDIFSLGVIIIEIVTGQRYYPDENETGTSSQEFTILVLKNWRHRLQKSLRHTSLETDYQQIRRCIQIGLDCMKFDRMKRPTISQVITMLQETESAVQSHPTLIDDNQILSLDMPVELLRQSINSFSEEQTLGSGTSGTVYMGVTESFASLALSRSSSSRAINFSILTGLKVFSYGVIKRATKNFDENKLIGQGGFGKVYKGTFNIDNNKRELAVKCVKDRSAAKQLKDELKILAKLEHRNVVQLVGFCNNYGWFRRRGKGLYVCSEFISNGSLDKHIFASSGQPIIEWPIRYQIIRGICAGLQYLHHDCNINILHLDLKPGNILLDEEMVPKIADFGLSRAFPKTNTHTYTNYVIGSCGYVAPEFRERGMVSRACDIYSLGVLILAIVMGESPMHVRDTDGMIIKASVSDISGYSFINKVREKFIIDLKATTPKMCSAKYREQLKHDASLRDDDCIEDVEKCVGLAFKCVIEKPEKRPTAADMYARLPHPSHSLW